MYRGFQSSFGRFARSSFNRNSSLFTNTTRSNTTRATMQSEATTTSGSTSGRTSGQSYGRTGGQQQSQQQQSQQQQFSQQARTASQRAQQARQEEVMNANRTRAGSGRKAQQLLASQSEELHLRQYLIMAHFYHLLLSLWKAYNMQTLMMDRCRRIYGNLIL